MTTLIRWLSPTKKIQYHFSVEAPPAPHKGHWIPFALFQDDTRIDTLTKVFYYLDDYYQRHPNATEWRQMPSPSGRNDLPIVAWEGTQGFLFQPDAKWAKWSPNPFKLKQTTARAELETLVQTPTHTSLATTLTNTTQFSFACLWDVPLLAEPLPLKWYVLYQDTRPLLTREAVFQQHRILTDLLQRAHPSRRTGEGMDDYLESGVFEFATRPEGIPSPFKVLFDALPTSATLPLIQWKEGAAQPVLYRLYKQHTIQEPQLTALLDTTKIPPTEKRLQVVYATSHKNIPVYIKCIFILGKKPMYYITVKLRNQVVETQWVQREIQAFKQRLTQFSNDYTLRFTPETTHLKAHVTLPMATPIEAKHLAAFGWLFKLQAPLAAPHRHSWMLTYLRSANMHQRLRSDEFIQSQMVFMEDEHELLQMIQRTFQVSDAKARELLKDYYESGASGVGAAPAPVTKKKASWVDIPATVTLVYQPSTQSYLVQCDRFLNGQDLHRMWAWLQGMMVTIEAQKTASTASSSASASPPPNVFQMPDEESPDVLLSSSESAQRSRSSSSSSARSNASSLIGGTYDLNEKLKAADPELFIHTRLPNNTSRYPRLCSANTNQQPVVLTPDEMAAIDASPYKNSYDGKVLYGSDKDPKKHHYYMCPRIWCPVSKIPLTPEQYNELGGKCPAPHHEEPWLFYDADYWGKNPNTPHYIGFHKKQGTNQLCLPCCKRLDKPPTEKEQILKKCSAHVRPTSEPPVPSPSPPPPDKPKGRKPKQTEEDYYLLRFPAPISAKRWGILPESLHYTLKPKQPYAHCYTQLKSDQQCPVRKGIVHHKDSLLNALGYILTHGTGGKREWLAHLEKHFTPQDFLALQNGWVLTNFLDRDPIYPQKHLTTVLRWRDWVQGYPSYIQAMQLKPLVERAALVATMKRVDQWRLSRELAIYTAWRRFWDYLRSTEPKDIYFMYDLMLHLNIRLMVWEKHGDNVYLQCPMAADATAAAWFHSVYVERTPYAMVMYENGYYEPIELKSRGSKGILQIDDTTMVERLNELGATCNKESSASAAAAATHLQQWRLCSTVPSLMPEAGGSALMPYQLVISPAMTVIGMRLKCGVYVQWPHPIPMMHHRELMALLRVKKWVYLEDLEGEGWMETKFLPSDALALYLPLLKALGFKWNVGSIEAAPDAAGSGISVLRLKPMTQWNQLERAVIPTASMLPLDELQWKMESEHSYWIRLQRDIGRKVIAHLDDVQTALKADGVEGVMALSYFHRLPEPTDVRTVLEGMPLSQDASTLHAWWNSIGMNTPYPIYTHRVKDGFSTHEWMFSQGAVAKGLPTVVRQPPKAPFVPTEKDILGAVVDAVPTRHRRKAAPAPAPANAWRPLPTKWLQRKQYGWDAYRRAEYPLATLLPWLANAYHTPFPLDILSQLHIQRVHSLLHDNTPSAAAVWETYLQDPSVWRGLAKQMKIPANKSTTVLKKYLKLPKEAQWDTWLATGVAATPATELDVWVFAQLTHSVVLVLHRSPSGQGVDTHERHGIQDFVASATVFAPSVPTNTFLQCPLAILFKEAKIDATHATFEWVQYKEQPFFPQVKDAPEPLRQLIQAIVRTR